MKEYKELIFSQDNSIEPNGAIGKQNAALFFGKKPDF